MIKNNLLIIFIIILLSACNINNTKKESKDNEIQTLLNEQNINICTKIVVEYLFSLNPDYMVLNKYFLSDRNMEKKLDSLLNLEQIVIVGGEKVKSEIKKNKGYIFNIDDVKYMQKQYINNNEIIEFENIFTSDYEKKIISFDSTYIFPNEMTRVITISAPLFDCEEKFCDFIIRVNYMQNKNYFYYYHHLILMKIEENWFIAIHKDI